MNRIVTTAFCATLLLSSCVKKDFFDSMNQGGNEQKPIEEYFDFKTTSEVSVVINYGFENYVVPFELYLENPYDQEGNRIEAILPFFGAFTDANSSFSGAIKLPAHIETVYVCSDYVGIPPLLELEVVDNSVAYVYEIPSNSRSLGHTGNCVSIGDHKMNVDATKGLYAIYNSYRYRTGYFNNYKYFIPSNSVNSAIFTEVPNNTQLTNQSTLGQLLSRISSTLKKKDNTFYCSNSKTTNLRIAHRTEAGVEIESAHVDLVFIQASGGYHNAMGYYYYKSEANLSPEEIKGLPKYLVFPRSTSGKPGHQIKARLQFFGEEFNEAGVDHFPPGYTIGWILIPNIDAERPAITESSALTAIHANIASAYGKRAIYSNQECNNNNNQGYGCVTLWDPASQKLVIGFEDQAFSGNCGDKSYEDILFYVDCDPIEAIYDPNRPDIEEKPQEEVERTTTRMATLVYEDIWPSGGDYDMNDVVIEYVQKVTYNNFNKLKRIEDTFKAVHSGAMMKNGFGLIFEGTVAKIEEEESAYFDREEDSQFILFEEVKADMNQTRSVVRTFGEDGVDYLTYNKEIRPFIVPKYNQGEKNRTEVHLPKKEPSAWINPQLLGSENDAYYVDVEGKYPFAIELVDVINWAVVTESTRIGSEGEYPLFNKWVESFGANHTDWYLYKK